MGHRLVPPVHSYQDIRGISERFLSQFNPQESLPVPIEEIAELALGLNIIPIPGLQEHFQVDGFISSDFSSVTVDQFIYEKRPTRYRFTLAHELAHKLLHDKLFSEVRFTTIEEWREFQEQLNPEDLGWLEWQAYSFAGLVLVPTEPLRTNFAEAAKKIEKAGLSLAKTGEVAIPYICAALGEIFETSAAVVEKRLQKDGLWKTD